MTAILAVSMLQSVGMALGEILQPSNMLFLLFGVLVGLAVGALPGIGGISGMAVLLPVALSLEAEYSLALMLGIAVASDMSDQLPAVMFGIPGTASAQATILDGHPLARRGEAGRALAAAYVSSVVGGLIGGVALFAVIPIARPLVLALGSPELFMLGVLGVSLTATLSGRAPIKGLVGGCLGLMLGVVGFDKVAGGYRWTFDELYLNDGVSIIILALGLFAVPEIIDLMRRGTPISGDDKADVGGGILRGMFEPFKHWFLLARTSLIGIVVGIIPGLGGAVVDWFAYGHALQTERGARETFGTGDIRGVIGVEAAANSKEGGGLIPTLLFGVPGSSTMALLLTVLFAVGVTPGPTMATTQLPMTLFLIWSLVIGNILAAAVMLSALPLTSKIVRVPIHRLVPIMVILIAVAAVQASRSPLDLLALIVLSGLGWAMKELDWPRAPLIIGFVLSDVLERFFFISTQRYGYSWLARPGVVLLGLLSLGSVVAGIRFFLSSKRHDSAPDDHTPNTDDLPPPDESAHLAEEGTHA